ncbi:MAG: hypothetical protein NC434_10915 [Ruminococcus sp.]|nr:hypothetical protein [Ruminococcus sp.]
MFNKLIQDIALTCIIVGISGTAGAIEHGTGLRPSLSLLAAGIVIIYLEYKQTKKLKKRTQIIIFLAAVLLFSWTSTSRAAETYPSEPFLIESTAYCYGETTADGSRVRPGIAAAKREWMGLTAILYEVGADGSIGEVIGLYEIKDTGGDPRIKNGTCIDIYIPDEDACIEYGRQQVYIQLVAAEG